MKTIDFTVDTQAIQHFSVPICIDEEPGIGTYAAPPGAMSVYESLHLRMLEAIAYTPLTASCAGWRRKQEHVLVLGSKAQRRSVQALNSVRRRRCPWTWFEA
jgi:hypothetical protein